MRRLVIFLVACHAAPAAPDAPADAPTPPTANPAREVIDTKLAFDVTALTGAATITLGPSDTPGASLEIGDLTIDSVKVGGADLMFAATMAQLDLGLSPSSAPTPVDIAYHYKTHEGFSGASSKGYTLDWPSFCGNLFPCHSNPADGTTFSLDVTGVPAGKQAVFPARIPAEAPAYQLAWSIDAYTELPLGMTTAGTKVSIWYREGEVDRATAGTAHLVAAFDWFERTLGPYRFGDHVASVSVAWPRGAFGGMEHHPFWHISATALGAENVHTHEAAHGWFGDGIRLGCWEDFVLSEGTVTYLAARVLDVVNPDAGAATWMGYEMQLADLPPTALSWPSTCNQVDVAKDLFQGPYVRGVFFYRAVALKVGAAQLDAALHAFYMAHQLQPAHFGDMLTTIKDVTGFDPTSCADMWLRSTTIPAVGACP